jgi:hypothetical protein
MITNWNVFNKRLPTDDTIAKWMTVYPDASIGFVVGPDNVAAVETTVTRPRSSTITVVEG